MAEMKVGINMSCFFRKGAIISDVFKVSSFQNLDAAIEKARLPKLSVGLVVVKWMI